MHRKPPALAADLEVSLTQQCGLRIERGRLTTSEATPANISKAKLLLRASLARADDRKVLEALARMSTMVARRNAGDDEAELTLACYAENLREFPSDIVLAVLRDWPNRSQWWPTWFELRELLEPLTQRRLEWLDDVEHMERVINTPRIEVDPVEEAKRQEEAEAARQAERAYVGAGLRDLVVSLTEHRQRKATERISAVRKRFQGDAS